MVWLLCEPFAFFRIDADLKSHSDPLKVVDERGELHILASFNLGDSSLAESLHIGLSDSLPLTELGEPDGEHLALGGGTGSADLFGSHHSFHSLNCVLNDSHMVSFSACSAR